VSLPGIWHNGPDGKGKFSSVNSKIWFLKNDPNHKYEWVTSQNGDIVPFAIDIGSETIGFAVFIQRVIKNNLVYLGSVPTTEGQAFFVNERGIVDSTPSGYQVLTCKSNVVNETDIPTPQPTLTATVDTGCSKLLITAAKILFKTLKFPQFTTGFLTTMTSRPRKMESVLAPLTVITMLMLEKVTWATGVLAAFKLLEKLASTLVE
jgi:hypothetical protein